MLDWRSDWCLWTLCLDLRKKYACVCVYLCVCECGVWSEMCNHLRRTILKNWLWWKGQQQTCWNDQQSKHEHTEVEDRVCALTLSLNMPIDEVLANADASKGIIRIWVLPERTQVSKPASTYWDVPSAENRYTANKDSVFRHIVYMVLSWHGIQHVHVDATCLWFQRLMGRWHPDCSATCVGGLFRRYTQA